MAHYWMMQVSGIRRICLGSSARNKPRRPWREGKIRHSSVPAPCTSFRGPVVEAISRNQNGGTPVSERSAEARPAVHRPANIGPSCRDDAPPRSRSENLRVRRRFLQIIKQKENERLRHLRKRRLTESKSADRLRIRPADALFRAIFEKCLMAALNRAWLGAAISETTAIRRPSSRAAWRSALELDGTIV